LKCVECKPSAKVAAIVGLSLLFTIVLLLFALYVWAIRRYPRGLKKWVTTISIMIGHMQTVSIIGFLKLRWPPPVQQFTAALSFSFVDTSVLRPECLLEESGTSSFLIFSMIQVVAIFALLLGTLVLVSPLSRCSNSFVDHVWFAQTILLQCVLSTSWRLAFKLADQIFVSDEFKIGVAVVFFLLLLEFALVAEYMRGVLMLKRADAEDAETAGELSKQASAPSLLHAMTMTRNGESLLPRAPRLSFSGRLSGRISVVDPPGARAAAPGPSGGGIEMPMPRSRVGTQAAWRRHRVMTQLAPLSEEVGEESGVRCSGVSLGETTPQPRVSRRVAAEGAAAGASRDTASHLSCRVASGRASNAPVRAALASSRQLGPTPEYTPTHHPLHGEGDRISGGAASSISEPMVMSGQPAVDQPPQPPQPPRAQRRSSPSSPTPTPTPTLPPTLPLEAPARVGEGGVGGSADQPASTAERMRAPVDRFRVARLRIRMKFIVGRFGAHAPYWQFVLWTRQLLLTLDYAIPRLYTSFNSCLDSDLAAASADGLNASAPFTNGTNVSSSALYVANFTIEGEGGLGLSPGSGVRDCAVETFLIWGHAIVALMVLTIALWLHMGVRPFEYAFQNTIERFLLLSDLILICL
jgi:hypothetical protein